LGEFNAFRGDQVVHDAHAGFGHDGQFEVDQVIVVLVDAAGEGIFDGHDGATGAAVLDGAKDIFETRTGEHLDVRAAELAGGLLAEGAALPWNAMSGRRALTASHPSSGARAHRAGEKIQDAVDAGVDQVVHVRGW